MIQVEGLSISYHAHLLFEKAVFSIQKGERCGLVGRNGSGKSTLFRLLTGQESPDSGTISMRKNYIIGALSQHIVFTQPTLLEEAALGLREEDRDSVYKAEKILFGLGFKEEDMDRSPKEFSGGYQLRLHLAKVLISEPDCLLLDEPTNYLDIVSIRWFARFLQQWKGEFVLITHDREFMDSVTTHTMGIHRNKVVKIKGNTIDFFENIFLQEEVHEKTRVNLEKKRSQAQSFIDRFGAKASKATQAQSKQKMADRIPVLEKLKELHQLDFRFNEAAFPGKKMIEAQAVNFAYPNPELSDQPAVQLIKDLTLSIEKGERIAIIGKNGRGKSTILRLLAEELNPLSGTIKHSENVRIGYFGQTNIDRLHPKNTVEKEIAEGNSALSFTEIRSICGLMMFTGDHAKKITSVLSGGEKSRVLLGKIVATRCNLLLLDEPTHHLDMESIEALIDALEEFEGSIVIVTHSELILKRLSLDKIVVCHQNQQDVFLGPYELFIEKDGWHDASESPAKKKKNVVPNIKPQASEELARSKDVKKEMARIEGEISKLEIEHEKAQFKFLEISQSGNGSAIQELSKDLAQRKKNLDELYKKLESM